MSAQAGRPTAKDERFLSDWGRWRADRLAAVNAPDGPPTLAATHWLDETDSVPGVPGRWWFRDGDVGLSVPAGTEVVVGRDRASGEIVALTAGEEVGPRIHFAAATAQVTTRSGRRGVRVFDHSRASSVTAIGTFAPSTDWLIDGSYCPLPSQSTLGYDFALESDPRELEIPGIVSFEIDGQSYETRPFLDDGELLLVFSDETTGNETKPPSRFLTFPLPTETVEKAGQVTLDFNRAFLPPCAFSDQFNCPLPPAGHRFSVSITAGETWATFSTSHDPVTGHRA